MEFHEFKLDYLKKALPPLVEKKMNIKIQKMKFIGGGSYGKVFKTETEDGKIFALKAYRRKGLNEREPFSLKLFQKIQMCQCRKFSAATVTKMCLFLL